MKMFWALVFVFVVVCGALPVGALSFLQLQNSSVSSSCVMAPVCLEPAQACLPTSAIVRSGSDRSECPKYHEFCGKAIYKMPTTGIKISLPAISLADLASLYEEAYDGQMHITGPDDWRPTQQAQLIIRQASLQHKTGLTIVEMGCAAGFLLYNMRHLAGNGGKLICFEPDRSYSWKLATTLKSAKKHQPGLSTEHRLQFFDGDQLAPNSVDVFMSSHTVEHLADPCPWFSALQKVLKPGGLVFTEVPMEYNDPEQRITRGLFHMMWLDETSWAKAMEQAGFERVEISTVRPPFTRFGVAVRSIFRKPLS